jgi:hypothetical protein
MRFILMFICSLLINPVISQVINYQTDSFADISAQYRELRVDPKTTLMVFDLDDTLITMSQPLGSVGWWDWQHELQKNESHSDKLFTKDYQQLVRIQNILFQLVKMEVTDEYVMPFLNVAANQGATLMGLTARGKEHLSATLMQLKDNKFLVDEKLLFKKYGLKINNKTSIAGNFHCPQFSREVIYQQGIMFLDGEDKGEALICTLANTKQEIKTIIFVDDAKRNSASIDKAFANRNDLLILNIFYTKENAKELKIQADPHIQTLLFEQWNFIKRNLNDVIIDSNF